MEHDTAFYAKSMDAMQKGIPMMLFEVMEHANYIKECQTLMDVL
jgi:hypothetical protein